MFLDAKHNLQNFNLHLALFWSETESQRGKRRKGKQNDCEAALN
jgi:hypothetical protein